MEDVTPLQIVPMIGTTLTLTKRARPNYQWEGTKKDIGKSSFGKKVSKSSFGWELLSRNFIWLRRQPWCSPYWSKGLHVYTYLTTSRYLHGVGHPDLAFRQDDGFRSVPISGVGCRGTQCEVRWVGNFLENGLADKYWFSCSVYFFFIV